MSRWDSRTSPASARRAGRARGGRVVLLCRRIHHSLPRSNRGPRLPRVLTYARDVTIVPPGPDRGRGRAAAVSASSVMTTSGSR